MSLMKRKLDEFIEIISEEDSTRLSIFQKEMGLSDEEIKEMVKEYGELSKRI